MTDIDVDNSICEIAYYIGYSDGYANVLIDNTSIEINNASGTGGIAYLIHSHSNVTITSTDIRLINIDGTINGIALYIGYESGSVNILIDNTSIEINNASAKYGSVCGVAYHTYD